MKKITSVLISTFILSGIVSAQSPIDFTVSVTVQVQESPSQITLSWPLNAGAAGYYIERKLLAATTFTTVASLPGNAVSFTDTNVVVGTGYEYAITCTGPIVDGVSYVYAGIKLPAVDYRGKLILMVDDYFSDTLSAEITRLEKDLVSDGWQVIRHNVARTDSVPDVKNIILGDYNADAANVKALCLLGHVPVPYSGSLNPDGHPDHYGAWPADVYYAEMNGTWTDANVNTTTASRPQNQNIPGDGKFDQYAIPGDVELQTGRIDFSNLPSFALTETQLMQNYLKRDHDYRKKNIDPPKRCLVDDNFGTFSGEAFSTCGWRIASILTPDSISANDYFTELGSNWYQWSYGCGGGSYTSCGGVGYTSNFAADTVQTIFTMLFGSYFGDWDSQDNFLRAPLASGALTCAWAGRPYWHFHPMSLGETIGFCARLSQNNTYATGPYVGNNNLHYVHQALMGDPSLREHIIAPPSNLSGMNISTNFVQLRWSPSPDVVLGYYVYKLDTSTGQYMRISPSIVADTNFAESNITTAINHYMVRAIRLEASVTGTYYNMSEGIFDTVNVILNGAEEIQSQLTVNVYPNPAKEECLITADKPMKNIQLYDGLMRCVFSASNVQSEKLRIDLSKLKNGIYFLDVDSHFRKLVIEK
jgi:hypothetical protein